MLRALDGLLISGGADVDPATYSAQAHPAAGPFRADRDDAELALVRAAVDEGVPVLGICRGLQVLNVALGGDLIQHLPEIEGVFAALRGQWDLQHARRHARRGQLDRPHAGCWSTHCMPSSPGRRPRGARVADRRSSRRAGRRKRSRLRTAGRCSACSGIPNNSRTAGCSKRSSASLPIALPLPCRDRRQHPRSGTRLAAPPPSASTCERSRSRYPLPCGVARSMVRYQTNKPPSDRGRKRDVGVNGVFVPPVLPA